jgi:hypothetical protein
MVEAGESIQTLIARHWWQGQKRTPAPSRGRHYVVVLLSRHDLLSALSDLVGFFNPVTFFVLCTGKSCFKIR